jgi:hypothetical protein
LAAAPVIQPHGVERASHVRVKESHRTLLHNRVQPLLGSRPSLHGDNRWRRNFQHEGIDRRCRFGHLTQIPKCFRNFCPALSPQKFYFPLLSSAFPILVLTSEKRHTNVVAPFLHSCISSTLFHSPGSLHSRHDQICYQRKNPKSLLSLANDGPILEAFQLPGLGGYTSNALAMHEFPIALPFENLR